MRGAFRTAPLLLAAAVLTACAAAPYVSPVDVTRFVGESPARLAQGTIELHAAPGTDSGSLEYQAIASEVADELGKLGYRVVERDGAQVALIGLDQRVLPADGSSPVRVGGNGSVGSYGSGVGIGLGIDLTPKRADAIDTLLSVAIRPAAGGTNLWEGRAHFRATEDSAMAEPLQAADYAASALFADFPGVSGETIEVE